MKLFGVADLVQGLLAGADTEEKRIKTETGAVTQLQAGVEAAVEAEIDGGGLEVTAETTARKNGRDQLMNSKAFHQSFTGVI